MPNRIYLAVPTHSETLTINTAITLLEFQGLAIVRRIEARIHFHSSSVISDLRNTIVADFLVGNTGMLFMLDADQGIDARTAVYSPPPSPPADASTAASSPPLLLTNG